MKLRKVRIVHLIKTALIEFLFPDKWDKKQVRFLIRARHRVNGLSEDQGTQLVLQILQI